MHPSDQTFSSVDNIDTRLGFFQQTFQLSGNELRLLACKEPRLITRKFDDIKVVMIQLNMLKAKNTSIL